MFLKHTQINLSKNTILKIFQQHFQNIPIFYFIFKINHFQNTFKQVQIIFFSVLWEKKKFGSKSKLYFQIYESNALRNFEMCFLWFWGSWNYFSFKDKIYKIEFHITCITHCFLMRGASQASACGPSFVNQKEAKK